VPVAEASPAPLVAQLALQPAPLATVPATVAPPAQASAASDLNEMLNMMSSRDEGKKVLKAEAKKKSKTEAKAMANEIAEAKAKAVATPPPAKAIAQAKAQAMVDAKAKAMAKASVNVKAATSESGCEGQGNG
jgi:colicin import membrane protein